jgi:hypothetical protein
LSERDIESMAEQTPIIKFVNLVIGQAIRDKASDIHFEPFEHEFKIRYRIDGALYEMAPPPKQLALPILSRIKVLASLNIAERRIPQDGRIKINIGGRPVDLRVSTLPTQFGESVVLRVLDQSAVRLDITQLGPAARVSPINLSTIPGDNICDFTLEDARLSLEPRFTAGGSPSPLGLEIAGPRRSVYFDPAKTKAAIVHCHQNTFYQ